MKRIYYVLTGAIAGMALLAIISASTDEGQENSQPSEQSVQALRGLGEEASLVKNYAIKLPKELAFAEELVPLKDFEVKERLDRELLVNSYWHSNTLQNLKLANRYFPVIEPVLKEYGVPDDFKYIALAESGLRNVTSPAGAEGIWQFLPETARHFGLKVNEEVDERYDIAKATVAAAKYFTEAHNRFDNWTLAAASYNAGIGKIENSLSYQEVNSYYDLFLGTETSRYIFRVLAFKVIYENTEKYGFMLDEDDLYNPLRYTSVTIDTSIHNLAAFATQLNINYKVLKYYNPWLQNSRLTLKKGETVTIHIPEDSLEQE
jgi:hypothetical protein